jgi:hypothetical protein
MKKTAILAIHYFGPVILGEATNLLHLRPEAILHFVQDDNSAPDLSERGFVLKTSPRTDATTLGAPASCRQQPGWPHAQM